MEYEIWKKEWYDIMDERDESKETDLWFHSEEDILGLWFIVPLVIQQGYWVESIHQIQINSIHIWMCESIEW